MQVTGNLDQYPHLRAWLQNARPDHVLRPFLGPEATGGNPQLASIDRLFDQLDTANPDGLNGKKKSFRQLNDVGNYFGLMSELSLANWLTSRRLSFRFAKLRTTEPDLVLTDPSIGIEVASKRIDGLRTLRGALDSSLMGAPWRTVLSFATQPLRIDNSDIKEIVSRVTHIIQNRESQCFAYNLVKGTPPPSAIEVTVLVEPLNDRDREHVTFRSGSCLDSHMNEIESLIIDIMEKDKQKVRQASGVMPTVLAVELSMTGLASIRPLDVWQRQLGRRYPPDSPFTAVWAMFDRGFSSLPDITCALSPSASSSVAMAHHTIFQERR